VRSLPAVIRNEPEMDRISRYIESNPIRWADDDENPSKPVGATRRVAPTIDI